MKIGKIDLYKQKVKEVDGEFQLEITDVETVPCLITNKALQLCKQLGATETSLIQDLMSITNESTVNEDGDLVIKKMVSDEKILKAIYAGYVGGQLLLGKQKPRYNYEEFLTRYNDTAPDRFVLYQNLVLAEDNSFAKGIISSTKKASGGKK